MPRVSIPPFLTPPPGVTSQQQVNSRGTYATLDNVQLAQDASGAALLVPGFTGSKEDFIALLAPLASKKIRAVAVDLSGQFETPVSGDGTCSLAGFASDVWAVAAALPRPLALVGHSFGGLVVREAILSNPLAADGLVLIASGPAAVPTSQQEVLDRFAHVMDTHGLDAVWQGMQAMNAAAEQPSPPAEIQEFLARRFAANAPVSLQAMIQELHNTSDLSEALATVVPPTTVVIGGRDDVWPVDEQRAMAGRLRATVVELPTAGHSPAVDDPEAVADAIASLQCFT